MQIHVGELAEVNDRLTRSIDLLVTKFAHVTRNKIGATVCRENAAKYQITEIRSECGSVYSPHESQPYYAPSDVPTLLYTGMSPPFPLLIQIPRKFSNPLLYSTNIFRNTINSRNPPITILVKTTSTRCKSRITLHMLYIPSLQWKKCVAFHFMLSAILHCICRSLASKEKQSRAEKLALKILSEYRFIFYAPQLYLRSRFINLVYRYRTRRIESGLRETQTHVNG